MYEDQFGLKEKPFENTPDPRFLYYSPEHEEAINRLIYSVNERKGAALLTGEYGCGKTVLSRLLLEKLPQDKYEIGLITNPLLTPLELLKEICNQLKIDLSGRQTKSTMLGNLNDHLYENVKMDKDVVLVIDEAQDIKNPMTFEELRLLLNFQLDNRFLMTLILIGQPELREMIDKLKQLKQRIAIKYHLNPLNKEETKNYILHRLKIAGTEREIFIEKAIYLIWDASDGIPRVINTICDMSLLVAFSEELDKVTEALARKVINDYEA